ncbi:hypothetical protein SAMN04487869_1483 [Marinobacter sp. DSM 26671]|jgi:hypothetical protein|uniref:Uncharacterized protein n=2 Tax=root TaxID=1 RepID=A0A1N6IH30_9GAMM|nr:hypothetical protein SAMN04490369_10925 [Halomonas aquamarina]SFF04186.1 hypothetical protein SAMN04487869_1483 [Marinobacter sp. DSM 26671]SIN60494.1 hypothetical protein SAMN05878438_0148 [Halomonas meridiana]SIN67518.1 hypothetical protein SAMN05878249_2370 [Halomonas meridiana]SIO31293.1 hypothetical protein SAMN05878442_2237 [Halomonas meridiana]
MKWIEQTLGPLFLDGDTRRVHLFELLLDVNDGLKKAGNNTQFTGHWCWIIGCANSDDRASGLTYMCEDYYHRIRGGVIPLSSRAQRARHISERRSSTR